MDILAFLLRHRARVQVLLGAMVLVFGGAAGCGGPNSWNIEPGANDGCNVLKLLRDSKEYQAASAYDDPSQSSQYDKTPSLRSPYRGLFDNDDERELGCMVLTDAENKREYKALHIAPFALTKAGTLRGRNANSSAYDAPFSWKMNRDLLADKKLAMHLYILRSGLFDIKDHPRVCEEFAKTRPECFDPDQLKQEKSLCWFAIQMTPTVPQDSKVQFAPLEGGSCRLCSREICGNGKDEDCDGTPDNGCGDKDCHHPGKSRDCYTGSAASKGKGICSPGRQTCSARKEKDSAGVERTVLRWGDCLEQTLPKDKELCNGLDDDCNGKTDEGLSDCCLVGSRRACPQSEGCDAKEQVCQFDAASGKGVWSKCTNTTRPPKDMCDGIDNDCDGKVDEDFVEDRDCATGQRGDCAAGVEICVGSKLTKCVPKVPPSVEQCDGRDNDCNGQVDELFTERGQRCTIDNAKGPCARGVLTRCEKGKRICEPVVVAAKTEYCGDGIDNDCDGDIDEKDSDCLCKPGATQKCYPAKDQSTLGKGDCKEGTQTCLANGKWGECTNAIVPGVEVCDGKDNDCDGSVDEEFPDKGKKCSTFLRGPCSFGRLQTCGKASDQYKPLCLALFQAASKETCHNGIDDDCNGLIDEPPCKCDPSTQPSQKCSQAPRSVALISPCKQGTMQCNFNGVWGGCLGEVSPADEFCNGKDDDCNGQTDERDPNLGRACAVPGGKGECQQGKQICKNGALTCAPVTPASRDLCDGLDNDCDGNVDEDDPDANKPCSVPNQQGECAKGTLLCDKGNWTCKPSQTSKKEECNGLDDDCNGLIDDNVTGPACENAPKEGVCTSATKLCGGVAGWLACSSSDYFRSNNLYESVEATCDGKDNDCDGKIDNRKGSDKALSRPCYDAEDGSKGPPDTRNKGDCTDGLQQCSAGKWGACTKAILPKRLDCNGDGDANCNGKIDKNEPDCGCFGSGKDGALVVSKSIALDAVGASQLDKSPKAKRPQPDIVSFQVESISADGRTLKLTTTPTGLDVGDEIMVLHIQGAMTRAGTYEFARISRTGQVEVLLDRALQNSYGLTNNSSLIGQQVRIYRVPHYKSVVVAPGGALTVSPWDGAKGGVLVFRVQQMIRVDAGGAITTTAKGYRGGMGVSGNSSQSQAGESPSGWPNDGRGKDGGGSSAANGPQGESGGGGGYVSGGETGTNALEGNSGPGGVPYPGNPKDLSKRLYMGAGGGAGGGDNSDQGKDPKNNSGKGGSGGGIIVLFAHTVNLSGAIASQGTAGGDAQAASGKVGGGGGGAGGSLHIQASQMVLYSGAQLQSTGGKGGLAYSGGSSGPTPLKIAKGGKGSDGLIDLRLHQLNGKTTDIAESIKGFTTPAAQSKPIATSCR